jgi:hypothetical protein
MTIEAEEKYPTYQSNLAYLPDKSAPIAPIAKH